MGPGGGVKPSDIVVLTPRSPRSSWLTGVKVGAWTLVSEFGPEGAPLPQPTSAWEIRLSTIHRFKGLESPVVILAEIDSRVPPEVLPELLYVGATRARTHLVVIGSRGRANRRISGRYAQIRSVAEWSSIGILPRLSRTGGSMA